MSRSSPDELHVTPYLPDPIEADKLKEQSIKSPKYCAGYVRSKNIWDEIKDCDLSQVRFCVCGPGGFVKYVKDEVAQFGLQDEQIFVF